MKKRWLFVLFILLTASSFCFADGFDIGVSGSYLSAEDVAYSAAGLNIAGTLYFTAFFGIGIFGNILYAKSDDASGIVVDALLGPVIKIISGRIFSLPVAIGAYGNYPLPFPLNDGMETKPNVGVGANIAIEMEFGRSNHFYFRVQGAYGFLNDGEIIITPSVGIGVKTNW
jgi:hypothetical protein